jgi:hypothetical protein
LWTSRVREEETTSYTRDVARGWCLLCWIGRKQQIRRRDAHRRANESFCFAPSHLTWWHGRQ